MPLLIPLPPLHCVQSLMIPQVRTMIASLDLLESKVEETTRHVAVATLSSAEVDQLDMREQMRVEESRRQEQDSRRLEERKQMLEARRLKQEAQQRDRAEKRKKLLKITEIKGN